MNLQIPEGANIYITIGNPSPLALTDQRADLPVQKGARGFFFTAVKVTVVFLFVIGSFWVGEQRGQAANADPGIPAVPPVQQAFPSQTAAPLSPSPVQPPAAGQVPPSFAQQLQQPPTIQPAPGQTPASGNSGPNAFGLHN